jgi:hypothetical protein
MSYRKPTWAKSCAVSCVSPHFSPGGKMIAQRFEFIRDFPKAWNNRVYFQLRKMSYEFKDQARFCPSGEKCGLKTVISVAGSTAHRRPFSIR